MSLFNVGPDPWTPPGQPKREKVKRKRRPAPSNPFQTKPLRRPWPPEQTCCAGCRRESVPPVGRFTEPDGSRPLFCRRCLQIRYREMWAKGIKKYKPRRPRAPREPR